MKKIAVIDYGMGNLHSVIKALEFVGVPVVLTDKPSVIKRCAGIILPGVGAFSDAMREIKKRAGLLASLKAEVAAGKPILGICLGMQLLFDYSLEFGRHKGLGMIPGRVVRFKKGMKVPHIGWNTVKMAKKSRLMKGIKDGSYFYFVHSYYCVPTDKKAVLTKTRYGNTIFTSAAESGNVFGFQCHPEKSSEKALKIYKNFYDICLRRDQGLG